MAKQDLKKAKPTQTEIVKISQQLDRLNATRGFVELMRGLEVKSSDFTAYREVMREPEIYPALQQRILTTIEKEWIVYPGKKRFQSVSEVDQKAADALKEVIDQALDWDKITNQAWYAIAYGRAHGELYFERDESLIYINDIRFKKQESFRFDVEGNLYILDRSSGFNGKIAPPRKFWTIVAGSQNDSEVNGYPLAQTIFWYWHFSKQSQRAWLLFLELFAQGKYYAQHDPSASSEEIDELYKALEDLTQNGIAVIPKGITLGILESAKSSVDYDTFRNRLLSGISQILVGTDILVTSEAGQFKSDQAADIRNKIAKSDADLISSSFNQTVAKWFTEWNFEGAAVPQVWRIFDEKDDLSLKVEVDQKLYSMGWRRTEDSIKDIYGAGYERFEPTIGDPAFSSPAFMDPRALNILQAQTADNYNRALFQWVQQLRNLLDRASTMEEAKEIIEVLSPRDFDLGSASTALQRGALLGLGLGASEVVDEV